jgi:hypothetical protein
VWNEIGTDAATVVAVLEALRALGALVMEVRFPDAVQHADTMVAAGSR